MKEETNRENLPNKSFILSIPGDMHRRLKTTAAAQGISLHDYLIEKISAEGPQK